MKSTQEEMPPKLAQRIIQSLLREDITEEILGDLEEKFFQVQSKKGLFKARLNYWYQVFRYIRPFALKKRKTSNNSNYTIMFRHNLILTLRNFRKYKSQFLINLSGLSIGLACVLFIYLWVSDERSVDKFHENDQNLYHVVSVHTDAGGTYVWTGTPGLLLDEIQSSVPDVRLSVATTGTHEFSLSSGENYYKAKGKFADVDFFNVFSYPLVKGDKNTVLNDQSGIVVSETLANRIFNSTDVVGKTITWHSWGREKNLQITAVMKDIPANSSDQFDYVMNWDYYHDELITYKQWGNYYSQIMVVLNPSASVDAVDQKITAIMQEKNDYDKVSLKLVPYSSLYLEGNFENGIQAGGRIDSVNLFSVIAIFILFISCINFINLSTAKASHRTKEIGVKKSLGASRKSLMSQYFTESFLLATLAMMVAMLLVWLLLPQFNFVAQKSISLSFDIQFIIGAITLILSVGLLAGSYPAIYLSGFNALQILRGKFNRKTGEVFGRKALVVFQFTLSIILISGVIVVLKQLDYVKNKNLGYDRDNVIYFLREGALLDNSDAFVNEVKNIPGVSQASLSGFIVGGANSTGGVGWEGKTDEDQMQFWETNAGYGMLEMLGMEIVEGRTFSPDLKSDSTAIILNETAVKAIGMEDPIGKSIFHYTGDKKIIGVVKDFNLVSLHTQVEPMLFLLAPEKAHFIMAKIQSGNEVETLDKIQSIYQEFNPGYVFQPQFLDQDYEALYASETRLSNLAQYFAGLATFISCLGLFGLAAFTTESRFKEIGIRKILGSSRLAIVYMLTTGFAKMVGLAILIALPVAYFMSQRWIENFAYSIDLSWWYFGSAGILALVIAWLTVGLQTLRAASINPADCLRDE